MIESRIKSEAPVVLASLFIASIIWIMARLNSVQTEQLTIPVRLEGVPPNVELEYSPLEVPIIVRYPEDQHASIIPQNFEVVLDVRSVFGPNAKQWAGVDAPKVLNKRLHSHHVRKRHVTGGVRVAEIGEPRSVELRARLITRKAKVVVSLQGQPLSDAMLAEVLAEPQQVVVTGSADDLQRLDEAGGTLATEPVSLEGKSGNFIAYTTLSLPSGVVLLDPEQKQIQATVGITEKEDTRTLTAVPIQLFVYSPGYQARVDPPEAEVRVQGKISLLRRIEPRMIRFTPVERLVEEPGREKTVELEASFAQDVPAQIRQGVQIDDFSPKKVKVEFVKEQ